MKTVIYTTQNLFILALVVLTSFSALAQNGQYDVRFNTKNIDCGANKILVDIEVRATAPSHAFNISDQNYRFSYNRDAVVVGSVAIENQILEGFVPPSSFYDPHTINGSIDTIVSYNIVLAGGDGVLVTTDWLPVATFSLEIKDPTKCLNLKWHDHDPANFPPTFIGEKFSNVLYEVNEGSYYNTTICPTPCIENLPIELVAFTADEEDCAINLDWTTATEINNDYFILERSENGKEFIAIATIEGAGTTNTTQRYRFVDKEAELYNYYRLTQVDFDGTETVFEIINIKSQCIENEIEDKISAIYPNPVAGGDVNIEFLSTSSRREAVILVTDVLGRLIIKENAEIATGLNTIKLPVDGLSNGSYFVKIIDGKWGTKAQKFIKIR